MNIIIFSTCCIFRSHAPPACSEKDALFWGLAEEVDWDLYRIFLGEGWGGGHNSRMSRSPLVRIDGSLVRMGGSPLVRMGGSPLVGMGGSPLVGMSGSPLVGMSGSPLVGMSIMSGSPLVGMSGSPLVGMSGSPLVGMSGSPLVGMSGSPLVRIDVSLVRMGGSPGEDGWISSGGDGWVTYIHMSASSVTVWSLVLVFPCLTRCSHVLTVFPCPDPLTQCSHVLTLSLSVPMS